MRVDGAMNSLGNYTLKEMVAKIIMHVQAYFKIDSYLATATVIAIRCTGTGYCSILHL